MKVSVIKNIPNYLTFMRIAIVPIFVIIFYLPFTWAHPLASIIFAIGALTDWLDGYLARSLKQSTPLGAFLDPVADKLMVCVALIIIVSSPYFSFIAIPAAIIVAREIVVSALREWMSDIGKRASMAVNAIAKFKTIMQMTALTVLIYCTQDTASFVILCGYIFLYIAAVLTVWSMVMYLRVAWSVLNSE